MIRAFSSTRAPSEVRGTRKHEIVRGKLVPDAHLAVLLRQHGVRTLYTNDRDFLKFDFLAVRNPFPDPAA